MQNNLIHWSQVLNSEKKKLYFINILKILSKERKNKVIFPLRKEVFNAFLYTDFSAIKVVIIGQDPYYNPNQAHGLAFSVKKNCLLIPPSLRNIQKEIVNNFNIDHTFRHGCLESWAMQGVFLLNSILTVESGKALSHRKLGWEIFTDQVIRYINQFCFGIIFLLWGLHAKKKKKLIDGNKHYILLASHPSPLSAHNGFFGCRHFLKSNKILEKQHKIPINWFF